VQIDQWGGETMADKKDRERVIGACGIDVVEIKYSWVVSLHFQNLE
jgi:hypothetical protein